MSLSTKDQNWNTGWREHDEARPAASLKHLPDEHLVIVDHGMLDVVLQNGISNLLRPFFIDELRAVAAHENDRVLTVKLLLKEFNIGEHVQTINAAVSPEVDEDQLASQLFLESQRC